MGRKRGERDSGRGPVEAGDEGARAPVKGGRGRRGASGAPPEAAPERGLAEEGQPGEEAVTAGEAASAVPTESPAGDERPGGGDGPGTPRQPKRRAKDAGEGRAPAEEDPAQRPKAPARPAAVPFPIIGIGASAGGLEALDQFLRKVPPESGMAFVVIQHLDPSHKGAMVELLRRASPIPVVEVEDGLRVEPDRVYLIPPNRDMSILRGTLHLFPRTSPRGLSLPIDYFFRALAEDRHEGSIGVVLSGMGSDGTLGLRAIKEHAGATFVQSLNSAKFDGMPRSAIESGLADVVAPAEELPARIIAYHRHAPYVSRVVAPPDDRQMGALEKIFILLRAHCGNDFSLYKRSTVQRRIERRMGLHQMDRLSDYVRLLRESPAETELLFKELLIGVTSFFRDPEAWEHLRRDCLPDLLRARARGGVVRAWVPACSTGEEAYSLAMVLTEAMDEFRSARNLTFQIFATDLDREAIEKARQGVYPANIAADVSPERLRRFFVQEDGGHRVRKEIRETVVFAPQNVITDPPFTRLDILSCRNLLIYLSAELQKKLIPLFHYSLTPGGMLFLGSAETVGNFPNLFTPIEGQARLYRRVDSGLGTPAVEFPSAMVVQDDTPQDQEPPTANASKTPPANLQSLTDHLIIQRFAPATVLATDRGDILYISGRTGKYLEPAVGKANLNLFAMARDGLRYPLTSAFASALREDHPVTVRGVQVRTNGSVNAIDLTVQRLTEPRELRGSVIVVFADRPPGEPASSERPRSRRASTGTVVEELERELQQARAEVQTVREEMQTSQEELKSTNEELQSTNEELQSTNEELTTSKEEMQSMNEELQTVNQELQSKLEDLARSNNDMRNLLNSTEVATLFLDGDLLVRRFTTQTTKIIKLIPSDAGRPITDITTDLHYPELADDAREVLRTLVFKENQVHARDGRWFTVRILPYRTLENVIDGVVITFTDSTASKNLERVLREQASQLRQVTESLPNLVWGCRPDGACDYVSPQWVAYFGTEEAEQLGYQWLDRVHADDRERVRDEWKAAVREARPLDTEVRLRAADGQYRWFKSRSAPVRDEQGTVVRWYGTHTDVDDLKRVATAETPAREALARLCDWVMEAAMLLGAEDSIEEANSSAEALLGRPGRPVRGANLTQVLPEAAEGSLRSHVARARRARRVTMTRVTLGSASPPGQYSVLTVPDVHGLRILLRPAGDAGRAGADDAAHGSRGPEGEG